MSNKQIIKKVFDEEFNSKEIEHQILLKYERKGKNKMSKIMKYAIVPLCFMLVAFIGISLNKGNDILEEKTGIMKVYAYTLSESKEIQKKELNDNVKFPLANYNLAMSSVPGYPIEFELDNLDYVEINVTDGTILDWNSETGIVKSLENTYQLFNNGTLYFNINKDTNIKIIGIKDKKEVFEKNISISNDDKFNYYAIIR